MTPSEALSEERSKLVNVNNDSYYQDILYDIDTYKDLYEPVKASMAERLSVRSLPLYKLHANPDDEFSNPDIGYNEEIVSRYRESILKDLQYSGQVNMEPLLVEKMSTGGYMILNGHHRWLAARMLNLKKLPVRIINQTQPEEILDALCRSDQDMCVSFDLDEVLICSNTRYGEDKALPYPLNKVFPRPLRKNAPALINKLSKLGFDIWVYTGGGYSDFYLKSLFQLYKIKDCHFVNGFDKKKTSETLKTSFRKKYKLIGHVDNHAVFIVNRRDKNYEIFEVAGKNSWASNVYKVIIEYLQKGQVDC